MNELLHTAATLYSAFQTVQLAMAMACPIFSSLSFLTRNFFIYPPQQD
jgi:hypothetical protein